MRLPPPPVVGRHAEVRRILADPDYTVPEVEGTGPPGTLSWLRATVCRFSNGPDHDRRRALAVDGLRHVSPAGLRATAYQRVRTALREAETERREALLLDVSVAVLAGALGARDEMPALPASVRAVAAGYLWDPTPDERRAADAGVQDLVDRFGGEPSERTANVIALLVQMAIPMATVISRALEHAAEVDDYGSIEALIAETLRFDSPVRATRRVDPTGEVLVLDLAAANRDGSVFGNPDRFQPDRPLDASLAFGGGPRACPGADQAVALACGVVEAALIDR
jgi:cytochrome P450